MAQLRPHTDLPITFVAMSPPAEAEAFKKRMRSPHRFIADPERKLYQAFGLKRASPAQLINSRVMRRTIEAMRAGHRPGILPQGDLFQLAGTFILGRDGEIVWGQRSEDMSDNVYADEIRSHLPARNAEARV